MSVSTENLTAARQKAERHERRKGWSRDYPDNPMVDYDGFRLKRSVARALDEFKAARPFRLEGDEFVALVSALYGELATAYDIPEPTVTHAGPWEGDSGSSTYSPVEHHVTLRGRRSVLTALHEFAHARGYGETGAVWWSVNAFRLTFPRSFAKLGGSPNSHVLRQSRSTARRTPAEAEATWRGYYQRRAAAMARAQSRASQQRQARRLTRRGRGLTEVPEGATASERRLWRRLGPEARAAVAERAAARLARQTPAETQDGAADPSVRRFQLLNLDDDAAPLAEPEMDPSVERFRLLDLD